MSESLATPTDLQTRARPQPGAPPKAFAGSIPEDYDRHLGPVLFEFSGRDMARRVEEGLAGRAAPEILEVACGTGISTEHLWRALPATSRIVATDLSPAMLEHASRHRGHLPGVSFQQASADALPFDDASFDALVCQFGIMFFDDKPAALAEFARVLRPGGLLAFSVWESHAKNPVVGLAHRTIGTFFESSPPGFLQLPFSYHDTAAISALVRAADFDCVEDWRIRARVSSDDARSVARGFVMGNPCVLEIRERGTADEQAIIDDLAGRIEAAFGARGGDASVGPLCFDLEEITFTARRC